MATLSYLQSAISQTSSCAFGSSVSTGNLLVLAYRFFNSSGEQEPTSVTDTLGNTWFKIPKTVIMSPTGHAVIEMWVAISTGTGANTVTCNGLTSGDVTIAVLEYGMSAGYALSAITANNVASGTSITVSTNGNAVQSTSGEHFVISMAYDDFLNHTWSASNATIRQQAIDPDGTSFVVGDFYSTSGIPLGTPYTNTYSWTGSGTGGTYATGLVLVAIPSGGGSGGGGSSVFIA